MLQNNYIRLFIVAFAALMTSFLFSFFIYPETINYPVDIDKHGSLGFGLYHKGAFSFYPDSEPTISRAPLYPFMISLGLYLSNGWYPQSVQIIQCFLFAATCLLSFYAANFLWGKPYDLIAGLLTAFHPYLLSFTSRIYVETLGSMLFMALIASLLFFSKNPAIGRAALIGFIVALGCLTKTTFLPFVFIIPLFFLFSTRIIHTLKKRLLYALLIFVCAFIVILPWGVRNEHLVHAFVPIQGLIGYNMRLGDGFIKTIHNNVPEAFGDFSLEDRIKHIWVISNESMIAPIERHIDQAEPHLSLAEKELQVEKIALSRSLQEYSADPLFFSEKILFNAVSFWFLGPTPVKCLLLFLLDGPLLMLFSIISFRILRRHGLGSVQSLPILLLGCYYACHLPVFAIARFSAILIPLMLVYSVRSLQNLE